MSSLNKAEQFPFAKYADQTRHPLLSTAARNQVPATSVKVEWLVGDETWENFLQIQRNPFTPKDDSDRDLWLALERHLDGVEATLWDGVPSYTRNCGNGHPLGTCGGVRHFLGREPLAADRISLRVMLDCVLLRNERDTAYEFLSEFSLVVDPAPSILPPRPRVVLPCPQS